LIKIDPRIERSASALWGKEVRNTLLVSIEKSSLFLLVLSFCSF
jgi:hypothetical protein